MVTPGFGGHGVLPGVVIGSNLNLKSSKFVNFVLVLLFMTHFQKENKSCAKETKISKPLNGFDLFRG